jgi:hypothetical protein
MILLSPKIKQDHVVTPLSSKKPGSLIRILANEEAWDILKDKFSFYVSHGKYCILGGHGEFESLEDLMNDLCKYGIPKGCLDASVTEEEKHSIKIWV